MHRQFYSKFNVSKTRIMAAFYEKYPEPLTSKQVAKISGMSPENVSRLLCMYHTHHYHYFQRLKKKAKDGCYIYKFNKLGITTYCRYIYRLKKKYDLNLAKKVPVVMEGEKGVRGVHLRKYEDFLLDPNDLLPYIALSRAGEHDFGLTKEQLPVLMGLTKEEQEEQTVEKVENKTGKKAVMNTLKEAMKELSEKKIKEPTVKPVKKEHANVMLAKEKREQFEELCRIGNNTKDPMKKKLVGIEIAELKNWLRKNPAIVALM